MAANLPIVLLPGIMGSRLRLDNGFFWDPDSTTRMLRFGILPSRNRDRLHARVPGGVLLEKSHRRMTDDQVARGWAGVVWDYYGPFLEKFQSRSGAGDAYAVGYDWRQNIDWLGRYTAGKLRRIRDMNGGRQLLVVTHSMGGLVLRAALKQDAGLKDVIRAVAYVCQPSVGAVMMYRRLLTGLVRGFDGEGGVGDRAFRWLLGGGGGDRATFVGNVSGLPGAFQLLPSVHYSPAGGWNPALTGTAFDNLYGSPDSPPGILADRLGIVPAAVADISERVRELARFHSLLGPPDALHPEAWTLYGDGLPTETKVSFPPNLNTDRSMSGDGTVPVDSATTLPSTSDRRIGVQNVEHGKACANPDMLDHLDRILGRYLGEGSAPESLAAAPVQSQSAGGKSVEITLPLTIRVTIGTPIVTTAR